MQRYFINTSAIKQNQVIISGQDYHHIKNVMRMKIGDVVLCTINKEVTYLAKIISLDKKVKLQIDSILKSNDQYKVDINIAHGLVSREKTEEVVRRLCELGVNTYYPILMKKSKYQLSSIKKTRILQIIKEACEQSQRNSLLEFNNILAFDELEKLAKTHQVCFFANVGAKDSLKDCLIPLQSPKILVVIGPEGGFDNNEQQKLRLWGYHEINLGDFIMRTETAPLYIASVLSFFYGDKDEN